MTKGFIRIEGIDFNEIYSLVVKHCSIRLLLALVAHYDLGLEQFDVKTTFLYGELEETIYMTQLDGFIASGDEGKVCLLKISLYSLKQSLRQWNMRFHDFIKTLDFKRNLYYSCVYVRKLDGSDIVYFLLYVDDILIVSISKIEIEHVKKALGIKFEVKDLGVAKRILGMDIKRDKSRKTLFLS